MTNMEWILSTHRKELGNYISKNFGVKSDNQELVECLSLPCAMCEFGPENSSEECTESMLRWLNAECSESMLKWLNNERKNPKEED